MFWHPEAKLLKDLTEVPAGWPLATVIDAFVHLARYSPGQAGPDRALEAVSHRLVDLWASQPAETEAWLQRCRELYAKELAGKETRQEQLSEALLRHGAAEFGKYDGWWWPCDWRFCEAGLLRGEPLRSAADREEVAAEYLQRPLIRDRCRELAERLVAAESQETARKRQKLEEETSERRRLEAELHKSQEEKCRDLRDRLAAAEAEVSSKTAELQTARSENAKLKEQCEELATRAAAAEAAVAEMRQELGQLQEEHGKCQKRCEELLAGLEAAEAEASEHAKTKKRLSQAGSEVQRLQEQLQQASAKGEAQRPRMFAEMQLLREELQGIYKQRIRELELQQREARGVTPAEEVCRGQEFDLEAEQFGCFMADAIFKTRSCDVDYHLLGKNLTEGSQVVAADGTILKVAERPEIFPATHFVDLHAGCATLRVTKDHPVRVPDAGGELDKTLYFPAGQLKKGDAVILDSGEAAELTAVHLKEMECEVLKIVFEPDLPVAVFSSPPCIQSKGHNKKLSTRRAGEWRKGKAVVDPTDGAVSIPNTAVGSARIKMDL